MAGYDRGKVLKNLKTIQWAIENQGELIPKIGTSIEKDVIRKLRNASNGKTVYDALQPDGVNVWYYNATSNWIHSHLEPYVPETEYFDSYTKNGTEIIPQGVGKKRRSSHYKALSVAPKYQ